MSERSNIYCLDANVLIQAWQKYYSPKLSPSYWELLDRLGAEGKLYLPQIVGDEISRTEDQLSKWLTNSRIEIRPPDEKVTQSLTAVFAANPLHVHLVDNIRQRSLADPWLIAHAIRDNACVVTKEERIIDTKSTRIRIPNVCDNMQVRCINDFTLLEELGVRFECVVR